MKKIRGHLILMMILLFAFVFCIEPLEASQEAVKKEAPQNVLTRQGETSQDVQKPKDPIDSSQVIPEGPQWLGAPIMPNGTTLEKKSGRLVIEYNMPYNQVLAWYQGALSRYPDTRYRDWKEEMYIEDQGASKWHAIKISKTGGSKTKVTIVKDNWTWVFATLFIRFTGVFVVLIILWACLTMADFTIRRVIRERKTKASPELASA